MALGVETDFSQVLPGAADKGNQFLSVLQQRCAAEGIGVNLAPAKPSRREERIVLRGDLQIRASGMKGKGRPMTLEVFADPVGSSLSVGWQLLKDDGGGLFARTGMGQEMQWALDRGDNSPDKNRQVNAILGAFQQSVFLPVLQQLADAIQRQQGQGQAGFFSA